MNKILVVEDKPTIIKLVKITLEREGYEVLTAADGREALDIIQQQKPTLVLMDLVMKGMTGYEAIDKIRSNPETAATLVVAMTAQTQKGMEDDLKVRGFSGYIAKPFRPQEFVTKVKEILNN